MGKPRSFERVTASDIVAAARESKSLTAFAQRVGITRQTAHRWLNEGKIPGFRRQPPMRDPAPSVAPTLEDASAFAAWCAATFDLSRAEAEIVDLAQAALLMARDSTLAPAVRLAAAREFRACLRDLNLPIEELERHGHTHAQIHPFPRPA